jgi:predicted transcriptional regulator
MDLASTIGRMSGLNDAVWLRSRIEAGATVREIAVALGCAEYTIRRAQRTRRRNWSTDDGVGMENVRCRWRRLELVKAK